MNQIFTKEYLIKTNDLKKKQEAAKSIIYNLEKLKIKKSSSLTNQLYEIIDEYEDLVNEGHRYLYNLLPQKLRSKLPKIKKFSGCFISDITGKISLNLELSIFFEDNTHISLMYNRLNNQMVYREWLCNEKYNSLLSKYLKQNDKIDTWIREEDL